ncbi:calcium-binding protein [Pseudomonas sp. NPDC098747]|uniref:calcium-binding protein n=1 Tax=Pseudomonas sp. NPDC098747 TaxID=3364487 RepID=UPI00383BD689
MSGSAKHNFLLQDSVVVTAIDHHPTPYTATTIDFFSDTDSNSDTPEIKRKPSQLQVLDDLHGPMKIGAYTITRRSLDALGATLNGQPLTGYNTQFRIPKRSFINSLQFSYSEIEKRIKVTSFGENYLLPTFLYEIATVRPADAPPIIREEVNISPDESGFRKKTIQLLNAAQKIDLRLVSAGRKNYPGWAAIKNFSTLGASVGIQLFGILMGLRGIVDAVKANDRGEIIFNSIGLATEGVSIAADVVTTRLGKGMIEAGNGAFKDFAKTRAGLRLTRAGGLIGGAVTLPFDIYSAVREFKAAETKSGKAAADHYVSAGLNVASAAMTVVLGSAAMAGFSFAGPIGLVAAGIMAIGSQIYGAVRMVDDIDDYIELTLEERWRTGWFTFVFQNVDQDILNRYESAKARSEQTRQLKATARKYLDNTVKNTTEAVVNGAFEVQMHRRREYITNWGLKTSKLVYVPQIIDADDMIDARDGITAQTPGAELGTAGNGKGILWLIGGGNDTITGVEKKPNVFYFTNGKKDLTGGAENDRFVLQNAAQVLDKADAEDTQYSILRGGAGRNTLEFDGEQISPANGRGYDLDLSAGTLHVFTPDTSAEDGNTYAFKALLERINDVHTLSNGTTTVTGSKEANVIVSRGKDTIHTGDGDDTIHLYKDGAAAFGESGRDVYHLPQTANNVSITEDGIEESAIVLDWRMDQIETWRVVKTTLEITLKFDFDDIRLSKLYIHDVYRQSDDVRQLINNRLTLVTRDKFHLKPDFPEKIEHDKSVDIMVVVTQEGGQEPVTILYDSLCTVPANKLTDYYVQRNNPSTTFITGKSEALYGTRIFLDFDSTELTGAEVIFDTNIDWIRSSPSDKIYISCKFKFRFGNKSLEISEFAHHMEMTLEDALPKIVNNKINHGYVLVFRDSKVHTVQLTEALAVAPRQYIHRTGRTSRSVSNIPLPLKMKPEPYFFRLPERLPFELGIQNSCSKLTSIPGRTRIDSIEGEGATYLMHLCKNMILRISTPGGLASASNRLSHSSTWELDASQLGKCAIELRGTQLHLGSTTLHVPEYGAEDLVDQIFVTAANGIIHTVDLSFDMVYPGGLDARFFEPPKDKKSPWPEEFAEIADKEVDVKHIAMADGTEGYLKYSLITCKWILESDPLRDISYSDLRVLNRCEHQRPIQ